VRAVSRTEGDTTLTAMDRESLPAVVELPAGTQIGRFVVERRLGAGGMGVVYAARDTALGRSVALKIVRPRGGLDAMQARLAREAQAMARLRHANVVEIFDIGSHDGQLFIAMELIVGDTLRTWVREARPWRAVVALFIRAGRALEAAHAAGLIHRDFKPDNVVVGGDGEPQITDFGLARELDDAGAVRPVDTGVGELSQLTATGSIAGTPGYMAPEQLAGERGGAAADQFAFCVSLFEVLYGVRPFQAKGPPEVVRGEMRSGRVATAGDARPRVPGWLRAAVMRGLAFDPAQRWPSLRALVDALDRGRRRRRRAVIAGVAAGTVIAVTTGVMALRSGGGAAAAGCLEVAALGNDATTILVCQQDYARSSDPRFGSKLADALRRAGKLDQAAIVANQLLATPLGGNALYTLGRIAGEQQRPEEASRLFRMASEQHRSQGQWGDSAADLQAVAMAANDMVDKLVVLDQAAIDAGRGHDARTEAFCHMLAAEALSQIAARGAAFAELDRAAPLVTRADDMAQLQLVRGNVYQNLGDQPGAVTAFEKAAATAAGVIPWVAWSARFNLVYSLAEAGRLSDATRALASARALDSDGELAASGLALEARIARHAGDGTRAAQLIERAIATTEDDDEQMFDRETDRAEIALEAGDLVTAERAARRAIARGDKLAARPPSDALRSWLITDRRVPHELLFAALARRGDATGALIAFEQRRGLDVLADLARGEGAALPAPGGVAFPAAELAHWLPALGAGTLATPPSEASVLETVRAASLLVLVVAHGELWRIAADAGRLAIDRIGPLAPGRVDSAGGSPALLPLLDRLRAAPADRAVAAALGTLLVPAGLAVRTDHALRVVLDVALAGLPVAALRVSDRRLIDARPVVLALRATDTGCAPRPTGERRALRITDTADRAALLGAHRSDLLDIASRVEVGPIGASLVLRDGPLRALEIAARTAAAGQVILAPPEAPPGALGALALAFVAAGTDQVIAPVAGVTRAASRRVIDQLMREADWPRALARLQRDSEDSEALSLAVFGRDSCHPSP
jgi:tetratricopeptide (TPR) repeat protein/predicted Ser/Thr protein kinase